MKYNRTYHFPFSPGTTSDDRIAKTMDGLIGRPIVMTEKLDGENSGWATKGTYARSHATFTTSAWSKEVRQMHSLIGKDILENWMLFGENMEGIHSIEYSKLKSWFYMFGLRKETEQGYVWASWQEVKDVAYLLGLETVPVLWEGVCENEEQLKQIVLTACQGESKLGGHLPQTLVSGEPENLIPALEGVVVRYADEFPDDKFPDCVLKWVRKDHVNTDAHWTKNWKKAKLNYI